MPKPVLIPSMFTVFNLFFGFFAVVKAIEGNFTHSAWFIIIAVLFDGMDGKIARWMHSESSFGFHMDSLADLVSVGVAPAGFAYCVLFHELGVLGILICFFFLLAGAYRLARFNVLKAGDRSKGYTGLPTPVAGLLVASFYLFNTYTGWSMATATTWSILILGSVVLMISAVPYAWPRLVFGDRVSRLKSIGILGIVLLMAVVPHGALFPVFVYYTLLGIGSWMVAFMRGRVKLRHFFLLEEG